jgi:hypothetical protein
VRTICFIAGKSWNLLTADIKPCSCNSQTPQHVSGQLQISNMPVEEAPEDEDVRQSYNIAPGYSSLVYRAVTGDRGAGLSSDAHAKEQAEGGEESGDVGSTLTEQAEKQTKVTYKLQAMKWGERDLFQCTVDVKDSDFNYLFDRPYPFLDQAES